MPKAEEDLAAAVVGDRARPGQPEPDPPGQPGAGRAVDRRVGLGLARTGSVAYHGSGEIFLGLRPPACGSTATSRPDGVPLAGRGLDPLFPAVVEATM